MRSIVLAVCVAPIALVTGCGNDSDIEYGDITIPSNTPPSILDIDSERVATVEIGNEDHKLILEGLDREFVFNYLKNIEWSEIKDNRSRKHMGFLALILDDGTVLGNAVFDNDVIQDGRTDRYYKLTPGPESELFLHFIPDYEPSNIQFRHP